MIPLEEFDPNPVAVIDPTQYRNKPRLPRRAVACWFGDLLDAVTDGLEPVHLIPAEHGNHPVHVLDIGGEPVAVFCPGVGAPMAVSALEVVIGLGADMIIGCGGAGVVVPGFDVGHVVVPTGAVRDEGTSYHYAPAHASVHPHSDAVDAIVAELDAGGVPYEKGLTWTTDAFFRETAAKVARRREQGCLTVEMEASAFFAVAAFRGIRYGQLLYAGDDVSAATWDHRHWERQHGARRHLFDLACGAVCRM